MSKHTPTGRQIDAAPAAQNYVKRTELGKALTQMLKAEVRIVGDTALEPESQYPCWSQDLQDYYITPNRCRIWVRTEDVDEWGCLEIVPEGRHPPINHALTSELDNAPLGELLGTYDDRDGAYEVDTFLLKEGLAPGQAFQLDLEFWYTGPDYNGEYDSGCNILAISDRENWEDWEAAEAWEALWGHRYLMGLLTPRD